MIAGLLSKHFQTLQSIVRIVSSRLLMLSTMFAAELRVEIGKAVPGIVECLKDEDVDVRRAAFDGLLVLAEHGMCHCLVVIDLLKHVCS